MSILERLETIQSREGLKKKEFEEILGKSSGYINTLRKNGSSPGVDVLLKISDNFPIYNIVWLLKNEGEMLQKPEELQILSEPSEIYEASNELVSILKQQLTDKERIIKMQEEKIQLLEGGKSKRQVG